MRWGVAGNNWYNKNRSHILNQFEQHCELNWNAYWRFMSNQGQWLISIRKMFGPPSQHRLAAKLFPLALSYDWSCYGWRKRNTGAPWRQEADPKLQSKSQNLWATWEQLLYDCKVCIGHAITLNQVWLVCLWFDCWLQCLWQFLSATKFTTCFRDGNGPSEAKAQSREAVGPT